jgi:hypothetical protein
MFISNYIERCSKAIFGGLAILITYLTFGVAEYFDRFFIILILIMLVYNIKRKKLSFVGVLGIILIERLSEELLYFIYDLPGTKIPIYLFAVFVMVKLKHDELVKFLIAPIISLIFAAELYWYLIGYQGPQINYSVGLLSLCVISRYLLFFRVPLTRHYLGITTAILDLDFKLYNVVKWAAIILSFNIFEYLIRHVLLYESLIIYDIYPKLTHTIGIITFMYILIHQYKSIYKMKA